MKIFVYNNQLEIIERLNYNLEDFKKDPLKYYPNWKENYLTSEKEYLDPQLIKIEAGEIKEKTQEELKIEKIIDLENGEYIESGKLIKIESSSSYRVWNKETNTWDIDKELIESKRNELLNGMSSYRDQKQATGTIFEEDKVIKGRSSDSSDALGQKSLKETGERIDWFFSSGQIEYDLTIERITEIAKAVGKFRTETLKLEAIVAEIIKHSIEEEIENFDLENTWVMAKGYL